MTTNTRLISIVLSQNRKIEIEYRAVLGIMTDARVSRKSLNSFIFEYRPAIFGMFTNRRKLSLSRLPRNI